MPSARFVEGAFKLAREALNLKLVLTPAHFMAEGFAERKLLLVIDFINACRELHRVNGRAGEARDAGAALGLTARGVHLHASHAPPSSPQAHTAAKPARQRHLKKASAATGRAAAVNRRRDDSHAGPALKGFVSPTPASPAELTRGGHASNTTFPESALPSNLAAGCLVDDERSCDIVAPQQPRAWPMPVVWHLAELNSHAKSQQQQQQSHQPCSADAAAHPPWPAMSAGASAAPGLSLHRPMLHADQPLPMPQHLLQQQQQQQRPCDAWSFNAAYLDPLGSGSAGSTAVGGIVRDMPPPLAEQLGALRTVVQQLQGRVEAAESEAAAARWVRGTARRIVDACKHAHMRYVHTSIGLFMREERHIVFVQMYLCARPCDCPRERILACRQACQRLQDRLQARIILLESRLGAPEPLMHREGGPCAGIGPTPSSSQSAAPSAGGNDALRTGVSGMAVQHTLVGTSWAGEGLDGATHTGVQQPGTEGSSAPEGGEHAQQVGFEQDCATAAFIAGLQQRFALAEAVLEASRGGG
jgi:hypothetical protein